MKIGQLAQAAGTQTETIRYYERQGLLPEPRRTESNYREYGHSHIERLAFIRHCRCLDMTSDEIRTLLRFKDLPDENCAGVDALLDEHIGHVASRIKRLKSLLRELRELRTQCESQRASGDCGILSGLEKAAREHDHGGAGRDIEHVTGVHKPMRGGRKSTVGRPPPRKQPPHSSGS